MIEDYDADREDYGREGVAVVAPDDGVPPALADRLERVEDKLDSLCASVAWLCGLAQSAQDALAKLEGHPMLGKLFAGQTGGESNGHGG